jgi:integrase
VQKATLTDLQIKRLASPAKGTLTYWDANVKGLGLRVSQGGAKKFIVLVGSGSRQKIGRYPSVTLEAARKQAKRTLGEIALGRYMPRSIGFEDARELFLEDVERRNRSNTAYEYRRVLSKHFAFGKKPLSEITAQEISRCLDRLKDTPSEARHALTAIKVLLHWAVRRGYLLYDPCGALQAATRPVSRERVLSDRELAEVLVKTAKASFPYGKIVMLLILTGQRRGEIASLKWSYIDTDDRTITLPSEITKNRRQHTFPFGQGVADILEGMPQLGDYLFPASREHVRGKPTTVFNGWPKAKTQLDAKLEDAEPWTLHDLRRTFSTGLASLGIAQVVVEKLLNHVSGGALSPIAQVYNRHSYMAEMRAAIEAWEGKLATLVRP